LGAMALLVGCGSGEPPTAPGDKAHMAPEPGAEARQASIPGQDEPALLCTSPAGDGRTLGFSPSEQRRIAAAEKEILDGLPGTLSRLGGVAPERAAEALRVLIADPRIDRNLQVSVLCLIGQLHVNGTARHILHFLELDPDREPRVLAAITALHPDEVARHADKVRPLLKCGILGVQVSAAIRLAEVGDEEGERYLLNLLRGPDGEKCRNMLGFDRRHREFGRKLAEAFGSAATPEGEYLMALWAMGAGEERAADRLVRVALLAPDPPKGFPSQPRGLWEQGILPMGIWEHDVSPQTVEQLVAKFGRYRNSHLEFAAARVVANAGDRRGFDRLIALAESVGTVYVRQALCEVSWRQDVSGVFDAADLEKWMGQTNSKLTDAQLLRHTRLMPAEGEIRRKLVAAALEALAEREPRLREPWLGPDPRIVTLTEEGAGGVFAVPGMVMRIVPSRQLGLLGTHQATFVRASLKRDGTMALVELHDRLAGICNVWLQPSKGGAGQEAARWKSTEIDFWLGD